MSTIKLYDNDAYLREFEATVVSVEEAGDGQIAVALDRTGFFPEAGGQSADVGVLGGLNVVDVQIDEGGMIRHFCRVADGNADGGTADGLAENKGERVLVESGIGNALVGSVTEDTRSVKVPVVGDCVRGRIDWVRRHSFMQHHSGEHLFSGIVHRELGYDNVGFHLSDHICTMDYNGVLSDEDVARVEEECNEWIYRNVDITCDYPDDDALAVLDYRCKGELVPPIRIVTIDGADVCACCAPHLRSTGEIGVLKVLEAKSYKGGVRLTILCGRKAFADYRQRFGLLADASHLLSSQAEDVPERISGLLDERYMLNGKISALQNERLQEMIADATGENALFFVEDVDTKAIRNAVNGLMESHSGLCGIFCGNDGDGYNFILGSAVIDLRNIAASLREKFGAKCGGSERMVQGQVQALQEDIEHLFQEKTLYKTDNPVSAGL